MERIIDKFTAYYGFQPQAVAQAPGRLEVLGNHTDYNEGLVLSCAVSQTTKFAAAMQEGTLCRLVDFRSGAVMDFDLRALDMEAPHNGSRYIIGMLRELRARGWQPTGFSAAIESNVPLSAGMSSSAALEVACGLGMSIACGLELESTPEELALAGQSVENNYLGLHTGLLDQFSSLFGVKDSLIMSDFRTVQVVDTLNLPAGYVFVVINSMKKHNLVSSEYNSRRRDCEHAANVLRGLFEQAKTLRDISLEELTAARNYLDWREFCRAQHIVGECTRVKTAARLLQERDIRGFGRLLFDSHLSSRENFENSSPELDILVDIARRDHRCLGARLSGGGFGGITIHLVPEEEAADYAAQVCRQYKAKTGIEAESFICSLGDGADGISLE